MVQGWANEKSAYDGQPIPSGYSPAGHYTAMVWQNTHEVGCGFVATGQIDILVCRYNPAGNIVGQMPYGNTNRLLLIMKLHLFLTKEWLEVKTLV